MNEFSSRTDAAKARLRFLVRVVTKEIRHLETTDQRLFPGPLTLADVAGLESSPELAERVEAFVGRFGRLQDTCGDKLLPALLQWLGERSGAAIDNLDRAERFGWVESADGWLAMRRLRNQMVHEYIEEAAVLRDALNAGHEYVPQLVRAARMMVAEVEARLGADT